MSSSDFKSMMENDLENNSFSIYKNIKNIIKHSISNKQIVHQAISLITKCKGLDMLCFFTYKQNTFTSAKYELISNIQHILKQNKKNGIIITNVDIEFLCIFKSHTFSFSQILQIFLDNTKSLYQLSKHKKVQRDLTVIPPHAIMKNGKMYQDINKTKTSITQTKSKQLISNSQIDHKQNLKKNQSVKSELPRMTHSKVQAAKDQGKKTTLLQKNNKIKQDKLPPRKLQMQSDSESQDYYQAGKFEIVVDKTDLKGKSQVMEIQNNGNYNENIAVEKMEIQQNKVSKEKQNSPDTNANQSDDDMDDLMNKMKMKGQQKNKPSVGAKSLQPIKQPKVDQFKAQPSKSVAGKQANLMAFFGKKK